MEDLRSLYYIDPAIAFLNHGSFGATPRPVFEVYQYWQRRLERQPVEFLGRRLFDYLRQAREVLGDALHAPAEDLVFIPNVTFGANLVARSLKLKPGDELLTSDHEYGACDSLWTFICEQSGARLVRTALPLPLPPTDEVMERIWARVTERTRCIFLSHLTSSTAQLLPVKRLCARARAEGILTCIDGAHTPGHLTFDLRAIGPDIYLGNCHKWLSAPKGSGFLYARPEVQDWLDPLVVGWGWRDETVFHAGSPFLDSFQWPGTFDPSAYLTVPSAIQFQKDHDWPAVAARCHALLAEALQAVSAITELPSLYAADGPGFRQMAAILLPRIADRRGFQRRLYERHRVEVPLLEWNGRQLMRVSIQGYNRWSDVEALLHGLRTELNGGTAQD